MPVLEYKTVTDPKWVNADQTMIDVMVVFPHIGPDPVAFTAAESDPGWGHSEEIFARAKAGEFGPVADYVAPPLPIPRSITRRQMLIGMVRAGFITDDDAVAAAATGAIPTPLRPLVAAMAADDQTEFKITWASMSVAERSNPIIAKITAANGMTDEQVDDFFRLCASV